MTFVSPNFFWLNKSFFIYTTHLKIETSSKGLFTWRWETPDRWVTCGGLPHLSCKRDQIKMRDYMDRQVTPPKRVEYLTYMGSPTPMQTGCKWVFRPLLRLAHAFPAFSKNTTWSRASLLFPWDIVSDTFSSMRKTRFGGKVEKVTSEHIVSLDKSTSA